MRSMPARFSQNPAFIICGIRINPVPNTIAFGGPRGTTAEAKASYVPMFAHLALVFVAGIYLPPALVTWFQNVARVLG